MEIPSCVVTEQRKWFRVELSISALGNQGQFPILELFFFFFWWEIERSVLGPQWRGRGAQITPPLSQRLRRPDKIALKSFPFLSPSTLERVAPS